MLSYIERKEDYTEEQIKKEFAERVDYLVGNYQKHKGSMIKDRPEVNTQLTQIEASHDAGWCHQFGVIFQRAWVNQFRQPLDVILKVFQSIFFGLICIILYYEAGTNESEIIQNNQGVLFFLVMNTGFAYVFSSVNLFNFERPVFIR